MCEFRFCNQVFRVCCVYAPNSNPQRNQFLDDVAVNTVFDRSFDRRGSDPFDVSRESSCALHRLLNAYSSIDIWRYLHPTSSSYTWTSSNGSLSSRIDLILVPYVWVPSVSCCDIVARSFSDHCAVAMSVCVPEVPSHGLGVWKLNLSVLNDPSMPLLLPISGLIGVLQSLVFPPWLSGGTKGKVSLMDSLLDIPVFVLLSSRSIVVSCPRWKNHLKCGVEAGFIPCLGPYLSTLAEVARMDIEVARGA